MTHRRRRCGRWCVLVLLMLACGLLARAQEPVLLERIVAIVDEEMILQSDLDLAIELYQLDQQLSGVEPEPVTKDLRARVLDSLIENKLVIAEAKQNDMVVEEEEVEARVDDRIDQLTAQYGSLETLERALRESGLTIEDFRFRYGTQLRNQQYMRLVVGRFIRPKIEIMSNDVEDYYLDHIDEMPADPDSLTLASILIRVEPAVSARRQVQSKVTAVQDALAAGEDFASVAMRMSEGPNASRGGRIGTVQPGDLFDPALDEALLRLGVGQTSPPVVSTRGVHVLRLDAVQADGARVLSQIFFPVEVTQADADAARRRIVAVRERVLSGEAFSLLAAEVSDDPISAASGGLMGTFQLDQLSPVFQEALAEAEPGSVTEPVATPSGLYIFQVLERTEGHRYTYEELEEELRRHVEGQKIEAALVDYIEELRERYFVDIKN